MNLYNLIFQMVELLYKFYYTNLYIWTAGCTLKVTATGCTLTVGAAVIQIVHLNPISNPTPPMNAL
jgi:hypothetical protein